MSLRGGHKTDEAILFCVIPAKAGILDSRLLGNDIFSVETNGQMLIRLAI